ncbi:hypothetical protein PCANC_14916 [Puccinia coronata f. sp. avenae]|uniref:Uncharacterized protein n=1 Tax=Puccinia coronata f. sp. avenae TaxID=200324 RepID=A0A2N5SA79_9BASI|nr:hypothetical protein PCANC_14916 [Puccinia coronata f. sp. avenae]
MSHTTNSHQPHHHNLHPPLRGGVSSMQPPLRPESRVQPIISAPRSDFLPPHLTTHPPSSSSVLPPPNDFSGQSFPTGRSCPAGQSFAGNSNSANNEFEPLTNSYYPPPLPPSYQLNPQLSDENVHMDELDYRNNNQEQLTLGGIDSQINHEALQQIFGLSETKLALAKNILEMSEPNVMGSLVYGLLSLRPDDTPIPRSPSPQPPIPAPTVDIKNFEYSTHIREEIRDFARRKILDARIILYSRPNDDNGVGHPGALINVTENYTASLPDHSKQQYFPPGYVQGTGPAVRSVVKFLKEVLKYQRVTLRNLLLMNVANTSHSQVVGSAPSLEVLYNQIKTHFNMTSTGQNQSPRWADVDIRVKVRFAYLRLQTAAHSLNPTQGHGSQWTPIDNQLLFISKQSGDYLKAWAALIMDKDDQMFGPAGTVYESVKNLPHLPTHQEILDHMLLHPTPLANNQNRAIDDRLVPLRIDEMVE